MEGESRKAPQRKSHRKSRTGCITCKIRRKKCDEGRPSCLRCTSTGRKCDGYDVPPLPKTPVTKGVLAVIAQQDSHSPIHTHAAASAIPYSGTATVTRPSSPNDVDLAFFLHTTVPSFSSYYDSSLWTEGILSKCLADPTLRYAASALGAAHREHTIHRLDPRQQTEDSTNFDRNYVGTVYAHAMRLSSMTLEQRPSPDAARVGVVLSFVFAALETLRGDYSNAITHLASGLKIAFCGCNGTSRIATVRITTTLQEEIQGLRERLQSELERAVGSVNEAGNVGGEETFEIPTKPYKKLFQELKAQVSSLEVVIGLNELRDRAACLDRWYDELSQFTTKIAKEDIHTTRLLKLYRETLYLALLSRINYHPDFNGGLSSAQRHQHTIQLKVFCSKLIMLTDMLFQDSSYEHHLSPARLKKFGIQSGLSTSAPIGGQSLTCEETLENETCNIVEKLVMLDEDAIQRSGLVPEKAMCMDVTSMLQQGRLSIRYCLLDSNGDFTWMEKWAVL